MPTSTPLQTRPVTVRLPLEDVARVNELVAATPYATRNKVLAAAIRHGLTVLQETTPLPRQSRRGQPKREH